MNRQSCPNPIAIATLLGYWLGELDPQRESAVDEHLLGCGRCSANLEGLVEIADAIRAAMRAGVVGAVLSDAFVERLAAEGLRLREYRVPNGGSVHCTVAPEDDVLVTRLDAALFGIERLDVEFSGGALPAVERIRDVPFEAASGHVVMAMRIDAIRALPASSSRVRLIAAEPAGERIVGEYTFHHTPWHAGT